MAAPADSAAAVERGGGGKAAGLGGFGGGNGVDNIGGGGAGMGGAVFNEAGTVVITNSTFTANTATGGTNTKGQSSGQGLGGGLFNHNGTITITNSTFSVNTAAQGGRDIFNFGDSNYNDHGVHHRHAQPSTTPSSARPTRPFRTSPARPSVRAPMSPPAAAI